MMWITAIICFLVYVIGTDIRYGHRFFNWPTFFGMAIVASIPYVNIGIAVLIEIECAIILSRDVYLAFRKK
jgi:hypothetical protein